MKTMSLREFCVFLGVVVALIAGFCFMGIYIPIPKPPFEAAFFFAIVGSLLWLFAREVVCVPLKRSFLVDKDGKVLGYHEVNRFMRTRVLKEVGAKVVPHVFSRVKAARAIEIPIGARLIKVSLSVEALVDRGRLQDYFNAFLIDSWSDQPAFRLDRILRSFLSEHEGWMRGTASLRSKEEIIEGKLLDWLKEKLPPVGLVCVSAGCSVEEAPYVIS